MAASQRLEVISSHLQTPTVMSPSKVNNIDFQSFSNIVDGQPRGGKAKYNGINPATKEKLWDVPIATQQDVEGAVSAARKAFPSWSKTPFEQRAKLLVQFADAYEGYEKEFTDLMVAETGKPVCSILKTLISLKLEILSLVCHVATICDWRSQGRQGVLDASRYGVPSGFQTVGGV